MEKTRQSVVTVATSDFCDGLHKAFNSFSINPFLELHAFIIGDKLPDYRVPQVTYHLEKPDLSFGHPMRELYYRRFLFMDQIGAEYVLLVDNSDVLCVQPLPELPLLLRGAAFAACVEHAGGRYLEGQQYTSSYVNAGVTYWHVPSSLPMREDIVRRGRSRFRSVEDQLSLNEVIQTRYYDAMILLPCQYGYRACLEPVHIRGWPTVNSLDGVVVYHNRHCIEQAKKLLPVKPKASLQDLESDERPLNSFEKFWRRVQLRLKPHSVK